MNGETTIQSVVQCVKDEIERKPPSVSSIQPISLIILDYNMSDKNGLQTLNEISSFYRVISDILQAESV